MTVVPVQLPNGTMVHVQAVARGEQDIALGVLTLDGVMRVIEGVAGELASTLERVKPRAASVEFELDFSVESGQLTGLFVKGSGSGTLKITLEWG